LGNATKVTGYSSCESGVFYLRCHGPVNSFTIKAIWSFSSLQVGLFQIRGDDHLVENLFITTGCMLHMLPHK